jgi:hypothetical protein
MAYANIKVRWERFTPTDRTQAETKKLFQVAKGERVLWVSGRVAVRGQAGVATSFFSLGDTNDPDGFLVDLLTDQPVGSIEAGQGAYLASSGGRLYVAADTVDATYTPGTPGNVTPSGLFKIATITEWE